MLDGNKFRTEYITTVEYSMTTNIEASTDLSNDTSSNISSTEQLNAKPISNPEPHTIEILRNDKNLFGLWTRLIKTISRFPETRIMGTHSHKYFY